MDPRFLAHNAHLDDPAGFAKLDPHLRLLAKQPLVHQPALLAELPLGKPGIYSIAGGRQIGKTTLLKQWMELLLKKGVTPQNIAFFSGELIDDHHALVNLISMHLEGRTGIQYLLLDEVSYIHEWDKGVKYLADAGMLEKAVLVLTGSDSAFIQEARMRFPGRRGRSEKVDFHLYPLNFREVVDLKQALKPKERTALAAPGVEVSTAIVEKLFAEFEQYMVHGGFLTAINDMARDHSIAPATLAIYSDWIRGDVLKRGKQESYLREILAAILKRQGSQVTWNNMAQDLSIDHPKTVADYVTLLASMDVMIIQAALMEDKLTEAPKKPRRLHFADPFIHHAVVNWLRPAKDPFNQIIMPSLREPEASSRLAESVAVAHVRRRFPTYYIKAEGEVDIAYIEGRRFQPVEVKWTGQMRPKDLKQVKKYANARIWTRQTGFAPIHDIPAEPLPVALWRMENSTENK
ncbi:MAG: ATP-binding protein [Myxococcales bacterium]|nr:MAG: ATP-binding protein [Myxococcales bacterium]